MRVGICAGRDAGRLVEPHVMGGGATAAGMGHLAVMDDSEAQFALTRYSQTLWQELALRLTADRRILPERRDLGCRR